MKSPGHREHPEHAVRESHPDQRFVVEVGGQRIADSRDVLKVEEDGNPARYYFPRSDVTMEKLVPSESTTRCPYKGVAHYYGVRAGDRTIADSVWTYEEPYEEHDALKDRVAFWDDKFREISVHPA